MEVFVQCFCKFLLRDTMKALEDTFLKFFLDNVANNRFGEILSQHVFRLLGWFCFWGLRVVLGWGWVGFLWGCAWGVVWWL